MDAAIGCSAAEAEYMANFASLDKLPSPPVLPIPPSTYSSIVPHPISIDCIMTRLERGFYRCVSAVKASKRRTHLCNLKPILFFLPLSNQMLALPFFCKQADLVLIYVNCAQYNELASDIVRHARGPTNYEMFKQSTNYKI
jgi:hypothetical protein